MPATTRLEQRRAKRLLRAFDRAVRRTQDLLDARYGRSLARTLVAEARREYACLIPELPDLRGRQPYTQFVVAAGWFLAFYRALARHGRPVREAGEFAWALTARYVEGVPHLAARLLHRVWFSRALQGRARRKAARSQRRRGRGDFVFEYVEGDAAHFDFGIDYVECAVWSFLQAQGAPELAPYVCALDRIYSEAFGWGLVRTSTLAEGGERCDFRFRRGQETEVASTVVPPLGTPGGPA
jgi:hypothetical protein